MRSKTRHFWDSTDPPNPTIRYHANIMLRCAIALGTILPLLAPAQDAKPLRLAIAGLAHGHVSGFLNSAQRRPDVQIVGVFDADAALGASYAQRYRLKWEARFCARRGSNFAPAIAFST